VAQQPSLINGFSYAQNAYNNAAGIGPYGGQMVAGPNGYQTAAEQNANNYATGYGASLPNQIAAGVGGLYGASTPYVNNATNMAANGIGGPNSGLMAVLNGYANGSTPASAINQQLSSALNTAGINGANSLSNFSNGQQQIMNQALSDPTQRLANDAGTYMNSAPVQSAINSTNAQIQQVLNEQTNPSFNRQASAQGNLNSSRAGMGEAMNNEAAAIAQGNADASILNNAYNTGLGTASNVYNSGLNTGTWDASMGMNGASSLAQGVAGQQLGQSEFNTNTALGAANSGLGNQYQYAMGNANTMLGANNQLGNAVGMGMNGATTAGNLAAGDFGLESGAGGLAQQGQQAQNANALQQWQMQTGYPWQQAQNYMGTVMGNYGQTNQGNGTTSANPNVLGGILGTGLAGGALFGSSGAFPGAISGLGSAVGGLGSAIGGMFGSGAGSAALGALAFV